MWCALYLLWEGATVDGFRFCVWTWEAYYRLILPVAYYQATALSVLGLNGSNGGNGSSGRQQIGNITDGRSCR